MRDADEVRAVLEACDAARTAGPDWRLGALRSARDGRSVWEIAGSRGRFVARLSRDPACRAGFERERRLTDVLRERLPVEAPRIAVHAGPGGAALSIRPRLDGEVAGRELFEASFSPADRTRFADDVVGLLMALQETPREAVRGALGPDAESAPCAAWFDVKRVAARTSDARADRPWLECLWRETAAWFEGYRADPTDLHVGHGDLHGSNLLVASTPGGPRLSAVFDFENAGFVNLYDEFLRLYLMDPAIGRQIAIRYNERGGRVDDPTVHRFLSAFLFYLLAQSRAPAYSDHVIGRLRAEADRA